MPLKWVDNLLSHHALPGIERDRQGVERRITDEGLLTIEAVRILRVELGIPLTQAAAIARVSIESRKANELRFDTQSLAVVFALAEIQRRLHARMVEAAESVARVARGRPRLDDSR
jgi:hypothetical protein